jgi:hypothetical protein
VWRTLPYGMSLLSPPCSFVSSRLTSPAKLLSTRSGVLFVRWEDKFDQLKVSPWWHVIKDSSSGFELSSYSSKTRNQIRRGLKSFDCIPVDKQFIFENCYDVYKSAFSRYSTHDQLMSQKQFNSAIDSLPCATEFWVVLRKSNGEIAGFSENYIENSTCFYNSAWFDPSCLSDYCAYALFYSMNRHYLGEFDFKYVSDGARSISHATEIHHFLVSKFHFRKAYSTLCVEYVAWLRFLIILLFPLRPLVSMVSLPSFQKLNILLTLESIRRVCSKNNG